MKTITVVTPCYNEAGNVEDIYKKVKDIFGGLEAYRYEHLFIDNASIDGTQDILRRIALDDKKVKAIFTTRNFGHIRSPYHGLLQADGDAAIFMASDFQDPPDLIPELLKRWEAGFKVVQAVKAESEEPDIMFAVREAYYKLVNHLADTKIVKNHTGFGLYDRRVIELLKTMDDPYPFLRGQIAELGFNSSHVPYKQPQRKTGLTKNNLYTLYDLGVLGIINHSKIPLRMAVLTGLVCACCSFLTGLCYLAYKLLFWNDFSVGSAPVIIGLFFISSVQLIFLGVLGEYVGAIYTQILKRPLVVEKERINF